MNVALRLPAPRLPIISREQFLDWVQRQEGRFEFDGFRPVAMTGGTRGHNAIVLNIHLTLRAALRSTGFFVLALDAGLATATAGVRYPDVLVTSSRGTPSDLLIDDVLVVFEVISPGSSRTDRVVKLREYLGVPTLRRYVVVEQTSAAVCVFEKNGDGSAWEASALVAGETLDLPEIGIQVPVSDFYTDVDLPDEPAADP